MLNKLSYNFLIALESMAQNKLRAFLTSLGIVFGVASVIAILAIGRGAQEEILEQLALLGTNNIIITPIVEQEEGSIDENEGLDRLKEKKRFSPGLTLQDSKSIMEVLPQVESASPEIVIETLCIYGGNKRSTKLVGITPNYFADDAFSLESGFYFHDFHLENASKVCIIGHGIRTKFFAGKNPVGKKIKCGHLWLTVIGVLQQREINDQHISRLGIRDYNMDIYAPINTVLLRYRNRATVLATDLESGGRQGNGGEEAENPAELKNYHQLDRLVLRVSDSKYSPQLAGVLSRMLERRHNNVVDFEITVPETLLEGEQNTKELFNIVLACIASISLVVGGIGIMNIMLASVMERIKEIGIRLSLGATPTDILLQFINEATVISITGGLVGILLGFLLAYVIEAAFGFLTIVSPVSVLASFGVALSVGLVFGIFPAKKAAAQDPVVSLRYE